MSEYCVNSYWLDGYAAGDKLMLAAAPAIAASVASAVDRIKDVAATPAIAASASAAALCVYSAQVSRAITMSMTPSMLRFTHSQVDQIDITTTPNAEIYATTLFKSVGAAASSASASAGYTLACAASPAASAIMQSNASYKWVNQAETSEIWTVI